MAAVNITLETLFDLLRTEKNREELQALEPTFYRDIVNYLNEKRAVMHSQNGGSDFFTQEDRDKSLMQFNNIRKMIRELYEKRERKIIQMALNKSKMNAAVIDTSSLLDEERIFYEELVYLFNKFRQDIVMTMLEGAHPSLLSSLNAKHASLPKMVSGQSSPQQPALLQEQEENKQPAEDAGPKMVRFLQPIPKFVGEDLEVLGPFNEDDVAALPSK